MKYTMRKIHKCFLVITCIIITFCSHAQQELTLNTVPANITSSQALINLPELNGNPGAIIVATPQGNTATLNTHPLGAWYYSGKWYLFNTDFAPMLVGLTYKIKYFLTAGTNEFLHLVTQQNLGADGSYIDNPALNNKPNIQFTILQNHSPDIRAGSWRNPNEAKTGYNATSGRWYITNINGQPLQKGCAYNIIVSSASGSTGSDPITNPPVGSCNCPASLPPNGQATGDLAGMYPNPMVTKLLNRPLSNTAPTIGQILKWNGTEWLPSNESGGTGNSNTYTAGLGINITGNEISSMASAPLWNANKIVGLDILTTPPVAGQVLKFGGGSWYPADDNVGAGGTGNGWNSNANNISNTNTGNVGIGNNNPAYQLDVSNRMRIRSGGNNSVSAGIWLNNNLNHEAALIGMADNYNVGFYGNGGAIGVAGWKFKVNLDNGDVYIERNLGIGANPHIGTPLSFAPIPGDKISLFPGVAGILDNFGFGIQNSLLQIYTNAAGSDIAFGYGSSRYFTEKMRIKGNGNVGIGTVNPAYLLDINNRMRIRSGGNNSASAGLWLNNNANTEAAFIGMEDDNHVGFYGMGLGWKFGMNTQTGALKINGSEGTAGQVLTSNGAGSAPTWQQPTGGTTTTPASPMQTFFKLDNSNLTLGQTELNDTKPERIISALSHSIVLTINSRLIISAGVSARGPFCSLGCTDGQGSFNLRINNTDYFHAGASLIAGWYKVSGNISNYMIDLNPGTYNIEFIARHLNGKSLISIHGDYSSIMVIPLQ